MSDTSGYKGWWAMREHLQDTVFGPITEECYANTLNNDRFSPDEGWDGDPPYPTGDLAHVRHAYKGTPELWESLKNRPTSAKEVEKRRGKTIYRF